MQDEQTLGGGKNIAPRDMVSKDLGVEVHRLTAKVSPADCFAYSAGFTQRCGKIRVGKAYGIQIAGTFECWAKGFKLYYPPWRGNGAF